MNVLDHLDFPLFYFVPKGIKPGDAFLLKPGAVVEMEPGSAVRFLRPECPAWLCAWAIVEDAACAK